jgi:hypothetical protein
MAIYGFGWLVSFSFSWAEAEACFSVYLIWILGRLVYSFPWIRFLCCFLCLHKKPVGLQFNLGIDRYSRFGLIHFVLLIHTKFLPLIILLTISSNTCVRIVFLWRRWVFRYDTNRYDSDIPSGLNHNYIYIKLQVIYKNTTNVEPNLMVRY